MAWFESLVPGIRNKSREIFSGETVEHTKLNKIIVGFEDATVPPKLLSICLFGQRDYFPRPPFFFFFLLLLFFSKEQK